MTDLEITRLCAEAMGIHLSHALAEECLGASWAFKKWPDPDDNGGIYIYDPLHDDAQAMALVKKFGLSVWGGDYVAGSWKWHAEPGLQGDDVQFIGHGETANIAICECVAKMQEAK